MLRYIGFLLTLALVLAACDTQFEHQDLALSPGDPDEQASSLKYYEECYDYTYDGQRLLIPVAGGSSYTNYEADEHFNVGVIGSTCEADGANGQITVRGLGSFASSDPNVIMHSAQLKVYVNNTQIYSHIDGSVLPSLSAGLAGATLNRTLYHGDRIKVTYYYEVETSNEIYKHTLTRQFFYGGA